MGAFFMLSIQEELIRLKAERRQKYILISEFIECLKQNNPNACYSEIVAWLLIKLRPNNIRECGEEIWGNEEFDDWINKNGIKVYNVPNKIDREPAEQDPNLFFSALEYVRDTERDDPYFVGGSAMFDGYEGATGQEYANLSVERARLEELLQINLTPKEDPEEIKEKIITVGMALTKTEEFIRNTDIKKSVFDTAERTVFIDTIERQRQQIAELQNQIEQLKQEREIETEQGRISAPQRALIALLIHKNYGDCPNVNSLADVISVDLKKINYTKGISYNTIDNYLTGTEYLTYNRPTKTKAKP